MARRLARRDRQTTAPELPHAQASGRLREGPARSRKKSPQVGSLKTRLEALAATLRPKSRVAAAARELAAYCGDRQPQHFPIEAPQKLAQRWREAFAPETTYQRIRALNRCLDFLERDAGVRIQERPRAKHPGPRITTATDDEVRNLLAVARPEMRLVILLCADCGLRSGEAVRIAPANFNAEQKTITFEGKGNVKRTLPVTERIAELFAIAPRTGELITPYAERLHGRHHNIDEVRRQWNTLKRKAGARLDLRLHDLRRTLATKAYRDSKDILLVQQILGHQSTLATLRYIAPHGAPELQKLLEKLRVYPAPKGEPS